MSRLLTLAVLVLALAPGGIRHAPASEIVRTPHGLPVVELFTSQGCSSCPAADKIFRTYAGRTDLVALSLNVDYWDYLGWKDTLASPKFSKRQRDYAAARGDGQVFTPQVVVQGAESVLGSDQTRIDGAIERATARMVASPVTLRLAQSNDLLQIEVGPGDRSYPTTATVWLAVVQEAVDVPIIKGENRGKTNTYYNVVLELIPVGMWSGDAVSLRLARGSLTSNADVRFAVLVQRDGNGPILTAAWMPSS